MIFKANLGQYYIPLYKKIKYLLIFYSA